MDQNICNHYVCHFAVETINQYSALIGKDTEKVRNMLTVENCSFCDQRRLTAFLIYKPNMQDSLPAYISLLHC